MQQIQHDNFVGVYDGFFSDSYCESLIEHFHWAQANNKTFGRPEAESKKKDSSTCLNPTGFSDLSFSYQNNAAYIQEFNDIFWDVCYKDYLNQYSVLADYERHTILSYKIQKTEKGGGYHIWHSEDGALNFSRRVGVYLLYLNDVAEGGETEFLYLSKRCAAKKGRLLIFPPNFPWAHRGNPPLSGTKYIMTGWLEFA